MISVHPIAGALGAEVSGVDLAKDLCAISSSTRCALSSPAASAGAQARSRSGTTVAPSTTRSTTTPATVASCTDSRWPATDPAAFERASNESTRGGVAFDSPRSFGHSITRPARNSGDGAAGMPPRPGLSVCAANAHVDRPRRANASPADILLLEPLGHATRCLFMRDRAPLFGGF